MRGKKAPKRKIEADPKFQRVDIAKLINKIMERGKKLSMALLNIFQARQRKILLKHLMQPLEIFHQIWKLKVKELAAPIIKYRL